MPQGILRVVVCEVGRCIDEEQVSEAPVSSRGRRQWGSSFKRPGLNLREVNIPHGKAGQRLEQLPRFLRHGECDGCSVGNGGVGLDHQGVPGQDEEACHIGRVILDALVQDVQSI